MLRSIRLLVAVLLVFVGTTHAQRIPADTLAKYGIYDGDRLSPSFHADRRQVLLGKMKSHSVALFLAAPERTRANDVEYLYHQDPNFYYLTGCTESNSGLLLLKDGLVMPDGKTVHELLFIQPRDPKREVWNGKRLGTEGAEKILKIETMPYDTLKSFLSTVLPVADTLYYTTLEEREFSTPLLDSSIHIWDNTKRALAGRYPRLVIASLAKDLAEMRMVKTDEELRVLQQAINISCNAHNEILRKVQPGWYEYEMQALGEYFFTRQGAEYTGYPCIVGSGENSTILHYETNRRRTKPGDFVEMDIGAEYHGYSADITRSFPVNGKFTKEQRIIYDLVLEAQDSGIKMAVMDSDFRAPHRAAVRVIQRGLLALGIIKDSADYRKYFMHGTSHYLGLDVHDAGLYGKLQPRNVITVEPGIYIKEGSDCDPKWWNIGCRIEDDVYITLGAAVILSKNSPRKAEDIEKLMSEN